jgi:uncharacterized protein
VIAGLLKAALGLTLAYAALLALLWWQQERLIFMPSTLPANARFDHLGPDVHEAWIDVDGARLHALHLKTPAPKALAFYLHGNAGNLAGWFADPGLWRDAGIDLFMIDYRGYGKSSGRIGGEAQLHADVLAAWRFAAQGYAAEVPKVLVGRSLGTALAARLAGEVDVQRLVLVSPYESLLALAAEHYPFVPQALLRYPLRTDEALARLKLPVTIIHGEQDEIIDVDHSRRLAARFPAARLAVVPGAGHNDLQAHEAYRAALLNAVLARR